MLRERVVDAGRDGGCASRAPWSTRQLAERIAELGDVHARSAASCRTSPTRSSSCRPTKKTATPSPRPTRRTDRAGAFRRVARLGAAQPAVPVRDARPHRVHGCLAQADRLGLGGADPVPGARRRQPRVDGLEHAAPGRAAAAARGADRGHRHGAARRPSTPARWSWRRIAGEVVSATGDEIVVLEDDGTRRTYRLRKYQRSNQSTCIDQRPVVQQGRPGREGPGAGRLQLDRHGRDGAGPECAGGLPELGRRQLRRRHPDQRAAGAGGQVHLDSHREARDRGARHQAGPGRDHARHPQRGRRCAEGPGRGWHRAHRRRGGARRHPGGQDHAQG